MSGHDEPIPETTRRNGIAPVERKWWLDPNHEELQAVQFALRMTAKHPWLTADQAKEYTDLADALWEGYFCVPHGPGNGPFYEDGDG